MKFQKLIQSVSVLLLFLLLNACQLASESDEDKKVTVENDEEVLAERVTYSEENIVIESEEENTLVSPKPLGKADASAITLTLVAEVEPPELDGETLQATEIRISGNKAFVSYNVAGEVFKGAVEIFNITDPLTPELISSAKFSDSDVNGLSIHGNDLYLASASNSSDYASPAILQNIKITGGKLSSDINIIDLPSYAATDVDVSGNFIYVTSGADGGYVSVFKQSDLTLHNSYAVEDARSVDSDSKDIAVLAGTNGVDGVSAKLVTFDPDLGEIQDEFELTGATIKHAKSTIEVKKDKAILAMSDDGTQVVCLATGDVIHQFDLPIVDGLDETLTVANAATAYKRSIFMANGEAGVYVAVNNENLDKKGCEVDGLALAGKLQLNDILLDDAGERQSINHIVYRHDMLFIAAGLGGLKIIKVDDSIATDDMDDE